MKAAYQKNGLVYRESSSEEDGEEGCPLSPEVIEIDDEEEDDDDDVIAVGCRESPLLSLLCPLVQHAPGGDSCRRPRRCRE